MTYTDTPRRCDVGHYLIKRVRGGPNVPMRVFLGARGGLYVEVAGEGVSISKAPWPPGITIDAKEYAYQMRLASWRKSNGINDRSPQDLRKMPSLF
mgnify:CR=1 FL=1